MGRTAGKEGNMKLRSIAAIWAAKLISVMCRMIGRQGVTLAGKAALVLDPTILSQLAGQVREKIFVVCGTNGKTTVNHLLCTSLEAAGKKVVCNRTGSNMQQGVTAAFVLAAGLNGKLDADYACIEADEASAVYIVPALHPDRLVLTNLFRDQLDRYGELDTSMELLKKAMKQETDLKILVNGDDPLLVYLAQQKGSAYDTYGISDAAYAQGKTNEVREGRFCKCCGSPLEYEYFYYGQLGCYHCSSCGFARPDIRFAASKISLEHGISFWTGADQIETDYNGFYNIYNILAVYGMLQLEKIEPVYLQKVLKQYQPQNGRMEQFHAGDTRIILNLAKNPIGFNQNIAAVLEAEGEKNLIVVIQDQAADGKDISWLWDVDFEKLNVPEIRSVTACGIRRLDLLVRLKYAQIEAQQEADLEKAIEQKIEEHCENLYVLVNYTALLPARRILHKIEKRYRTKQGERRKFCVGKTIF